MVVMAKVKTLTCYVKRFFYINLALSVPVYIYFMYQFKQMGLY